MGHKQAGTETSSYARECYGIIFFYRIGKTLSMQNRDNNIIPENYTGKAVDIAHFRTEESVEKAIRVFSAIKSTFLRPGKWRSVAGKATAEFEIDSLLGKDGEIKEGDFIKIDIPGPGPSNGEGYDWVRAEKVLKNVIDGADESVFIQLRACPDPHTKGEEVAHFFSNEATSSLILKREGQKILASYHGRNERPNTDSNKIADTVRNAVVAAGAMIGLSEVQWEALIKGFVSDEVAGV